MKSSMYSVLLLSSLAFVQIATAQTPTQTFDLPLQGITIEADAAGLWQRIYATGRQAVEFPDRRGISTAQKIAEERAKAEIVKFFQQQVSADTLVNDMESTSQTARRTQGTGADATTKESERKVATSVAETLRSSSQGTLRGVVVLEVGYDEKQGDAWVKVGVSRASMAIAGSAQEAMAAPAASSSATGRAGASVSPVTTSDPVVRQPSEVRRGSPLPTTSTPRSFVEARSFVRGLRLLSKAEWETYVASGEKPADIPATPDLAYRDMGWVSWDNWLGIR